MNIGDRVKIKNISDTDGHAYDGQEGVIVGFGEDPTSPWPVNLQVDGCNIPDVPFAREELEVIE